MYAFDLRSLIVLLFPLLMSCGGESGNGTDYDWVMPQHASASYDGSREPAVLDRAAVAWMPANIQLALLVALDYTSGAVEPVYRQLLLEDTYADGQGGSYSFKASYSKSGTEDWFYFEFDNYTVNGVTLNGAYLQDTNAGAHSFYRSVHYSFYDLETRAPGYRSVTRGTIDVDVDDIAATTTSHISIKYPDAGYEIFLDDTKLIHTFLDDGTVAASFAGRVYDSQFGGIWMTAESGIASETYNGQQVLSGGDFDVTPSGGGGAGVQLGFLNRIFSSYAFDVDGKKKTIRLDNDPSAVPSFVLASSAPIADGKSLSEQMLNEKIFLDGRFSVSYQDHPLSYEWELLSAPHGAVLEFGDMNKPVAYLRSDTAGKYHLRLVVDDGIRKDSDILVVEMVDEPQQEIETEGGVMQVVQSEDGAARVFVDARTAMARRQSSIEIAFPPLLTDPVLSGYSGPTLPLNDNGTAVFDLQDHRAAMVMDAGLPLERSSLTSIQRHGSPAFSIVLNVLDNAEPVDYLETRQVAAHDIDNDGVDEIVHLAYGWDGNIPFEGIFVLSRHANEYSFREVYLPVADGEVFTLGDVTDDGNAELVVITRCAINVYESAGSGFSEIASLPKSGCWLGYGELPTIADLDGDGKASLLVRDGSEIRFLEFDGGGAVTRDELISFSHMVPGYPFMVTIRDFVVLDANLDGRLDIIVSTEGSTQQAKGFSTFLQDTDDSTFTQGEFVQGLYVKAAGDVTGDARSDLVAGTYGKIQIWLASSDGLIASGYLETESNYNELSGPLPHIDSYGRPGLINVDADPAMELYVVSYAFYEDILVDFSAAGVVEKYSFPTTTDGQGAVFLGAGGTGLSVRGAMQTDYDGDGKQDLLFSDGQLLLLE